MAERQDLVRQVASFGAEVPTTPLHWKREGHHLEWCVRQLSWLPPWVASDEVDVCDMARLAVRRAGARDPCGEEVVAASPPRSEPASEDEASVVSCVESLDDDVDDAVVEPPGSVATDAAPRTPPSRPVPRGGTPRESPGQRAFARDVDSSHPRRLWRRQAAKVCRDRLGCGRTPAFWFTLNAPYNSLRDIHRFHASVRALTLGSEATAPLAMSGSEAAGVGAASAFARDVRRRRAAGVAWVRENPDIVAFVHALRVELQVRLLMSHVVPPEPQAPFQFWFRFEYGSNGNPHAHGLCYVPRNPAFECVVADDAARDRMLRDGRRDAARLRTMQEATRDIAAFFDRASLSQVPLVPFGFRLQSHKSSGSPGKKKDTKRGQPIKEHDILFCMRERRFQLKVLVLCSER